MGITIHTKDDFDGMRKAGLLAAQVLDFITPHVRVGVTTNELDKLCHDFILAHSAIPAPLGYKGYPKSICTSKNDVVCHGIPDDKPLKNTDILNIDVTVILNGWHGDTSRMYWADEQCIITSKGKFIKARRLCEATYRAMMEAINVIRPNMKLNVIGKTIENVISDYGYSIVEEYCGHGLGREFHTEPSVCHFYTEAVDTIIQEGMFFTIEPMINAGRRKDTLLDSIDGWTVRTKDHELSAQFEHSVGITSEGAEIFTLSPKGLHYPPYGMQ